MKINKFLIFLASGFLLISLPVYFYLVWAGKRKVELRKSAWEELENQIKKDATAFGQESAIVVKDLSTGWEIKLNENKLIPSASLVKVPIMAVCFWLSETNSLDLKDCLVLKNSYKTTGSGVLKEYASGTRFTLEELIELMVADSDNTAANMVIGCIGQEKFGGYFKELGLNNTNLGRKMMDFQSRKEGIENYTTASDMAILFEKIYEGKLINKNISRKCLEVLKKQKIRDRIPRRLPLGTMVAHKTGLEYGICHDVGIVYTLQGNYLICVLTRHNYKTARPAKKFIQKIALDTYNYFQY